MMSSGTSKSHSSYQDPRYLQMWLVFDWPKPTDRVPVECAGCGWTGRRARRSAEETPCPRCAGPVTTRRPGRRIGRSTGHDNVVQLASRSRDGEGRAGQPGRAVRRS
jgi:hypothetical protein